MVAVAKTKKKTRTKNNKKRFPNMPKTAIISSIVMSFQGNKTAYDPK
jgi:hypothetical protein